MSAETATHDFLTAFYRGDAHAARAFLADDFEFSGPFTTVSGAERFLASASPLLAAARHTTIRQTWAAGEQVCVVHDVALRNRSAQCAGQRRTAAGQSETSEWAKWMTQLRLCAHRH